jgi:hypothetical protein
MLIPSLGVKNFALCRTFEENWCCFVNGGRTGGQRLCMLGTSCNLPAFEAGCVFCCHCCYFNPVVFRQLIQRSRFDRLFLLCCWTVHLFSLLGHTPDRPVTLYDCQMFRLCERGYFVFCWVPGPAGLPGCQCCCKISCFRQSVPCDQLTSIQWTNTHNNKLQGVKPTV